MEILYRVIGLALPTSHDQVGVLDLGNLPYESPQLVLDALDPRELDLHCLLEVFAVMPANVTGLILDHSDLHREDTLYTELTVRPAELDHFASGHQIPAHLW